MTVVINHHLVLTKREWKAVINALDFMDLQLHGDHPIQDFIIDDLKDAFPSGFICETSAKIASSN